MNNKTKEFKKLQAEWYSKLEDEGFQDVEQDEEHLKRWTSSFFKTRYNPTLWKAKEEYYRAAGHFLHDYKFSNDTEKLIWELHGEAMSIRNIALVLKAKGIKSYKRRIHETIQKLAKEMVNKCSKKPT